MMFSCLGDEVEQIPPQCYHWQEPEAFVVNQPSWVHTRQHLAPSETL